MRKRTNIKVVLSKFAVVLRGTARDVKPSERAKSTREMGKNSTTSGPIEPEVWIMSGLLSSLVLQIVGVSLQRRHGEKLETNMENNND
jgi:hypothetical protein